jgi:hypothetical protein
MTMTLRELVAQSNMREFDPTKELHYPVLLVKLIDPGCTAELQIENAVTGEVTRLTTTEDGDDEQVFIDALTTAFRAAWDARCRQVYDDTGSQ